MKKKLLLTTALVAFSMPALASDYDGKTWKNYTGNNYGGVYWVTGGENLTVDAATFENNIANSIGGALGIGTGGTKLTVTNSVFNNNHALMDGGAIGAYKALDIVGSTFNSNTSNYNKDSSGAWSVVVEDPDGTEISGGAISLGSESSATITGSTFTNNKTGTYGGAIGTRHAVNRLSGSKNNNENATLNIEADFTGNYARLNGGAIYNSFYAGENGVTVKGNFTSNTAGVYGGAIFNDGAKDNKGNDGGVMTITDSTFTSNSAIQGGAIYSGNSVDGDAGKASLVVKNSTFTSNSADYFGAIASGTRTKKTAIENTTFENNSALEVGAVGLFGDDNTLKNVKFIGNKATSTDASSDGTGALFLGAVSKTVLDNVTFDGNTSGTKGGAIATRTADMGNNKDARLDILNSTFKNNIAKTTGGAFDNYLYSSVQDVAAVYVSDTTFEANQAANGGAVYNHGQPDKGGNTASTSINNSTFTGNIATALGGAIYNEEGGAIKLSGTNTFSGNTAGGKANDIHNLGELNVSGELTLDGGITGDGTLAFKDNATLGATYNTTKIENKADLTGLQKIKLAISEVVDSLELDNLFTHADNVKGDGYNSAGLTIENSMYDFTLDETDKTYSKYTIAQKSSEEIAENLGTTTEDASALLSATSSSSDNQAFNEAAGALSVAAQSGDASAVSEAKKLGATETPVVSSQETGVHDVLFGVVTSELNGEQGAMARGLASGDYFRKASAWIRGLFNKADHETTNKAEGFNSDTYGVAMGIDSEVNENTRLGFGYANSQTDIKSAGRDTDVDTNSLFVYAKYQPKDWYINTILAYSWSEYDEKKSVMGYDASAKYDVDTIALQSMYGYETAYKGYDVTPEFGLRYLHINQDAYKNKLGSEVSANQEDVLTAVFGAKLAKNYALENGAVVRPELRAAVTYDLFDADNSANVLLANGASYTVDGEKLDRLGFELGAKVTTKATEKVEVSAGYLTRIREDYQDHTLTVDAKYNF